MRSSPILQAVEPISCYSVDHTWSMVSKTLVYRKRCANAKSGNIVMVAVGDVDHPAVKCGSVNFNYVLFGVVIDFIYINWEIERTDEE